MFYGREEGFSGIEICIDVVLVDDEGNFWVGIMNGFMFKENKFLWVMEVRLLFFLFYNICIFYKFVEEVLDI